MLIAVPRVYPLLGMFAGYLILMFSNPIRVSLRDGFRCISRFKRIWLTFALLGLAYSVFQFAIFTPLQRTSDLNLAQLAFWETWHWPTFGEIWRESILRAAEAVAGIFDDAATTYPLSVIAAILLIGNWRGMHGSLVRALRKRFRFWGFLIYLAVLIAALAALLKPLLFWQLPEWWRILSAARLLQASATVDTVAFLFEYLCGIYIQVYLITVCFAWIKGLHFEEEPLFGFAMRRFSFVLKWSSIVVLVSSLVLRLPLLVAYFRNVPNVLDYLPIGRWIMCALIVCFGSMQISLVLHNESLSEAFRAHRGFLRRNAGHFGWFLIICAVHFWFLALCDAAVHLAAADRPIALIIWKVIYVFLRGLITGWLLASWVCLFRQSEIARMNRESWIRY
jgi:hypothetical protein